MNGLKKYFKDGSSYSLAVFSVFIGLMIMTSAGCSVVAATKQPPKKDLSVLNQGTHIGRVIAEFGKPIWEGEREGKTAHVYKFNKGYGRGAKAGRAFFHGAADVATLGLWEVVGNPTEAALSGKEMQVEVIYDENNRVYTSTILSAKGI